EISDEMIEEAMQLSCAHDFIQDMPKGIYEPVMERGSTFSAGQKQLLSFARALAHQPAVLVLDEATANVDTQTEIVIQRAIENISKNRTTLVIAHRLSTIRYSDQIIVLKRGEVVESGSHELLMKSRGYYANLVKYSKQNQLIE
ncbi:MAG: ATP-binding cassette domain-containing protein, partial [Turicibacter sp.]